MEKHQKNKSQNHKNHNNFRTILELVAREKTLRISVILVIL